MAKRRKLILLLLVLVVIVAISLPLMMVRRGFSARSEPMLIEALMARTLRSAAVPARIKAMRNPVPFTDAAVRDGMEHFADHCATCHANNGDGKTDFGMGMYPKPPDMRSGHTQEMSDGEIYATIRSGIRLTGMPAFGDSERDDDESTWRLVHFIRHLPKLTPQEEAAMKKLNPKTAEEWKQEQEVDDFLSEGNPSPASKPHKH